MHAYMYLRLGLRALGHHLCVLGLLRLRGSTAAAVPRCEFIIVVSVFERRRVKESHLDRAETTFPPKGPGLGFGLSVISGQREQKNAETTLGGAQGQEW